MDEKKNEIILNDHVIEHRESFISQDINMFQLLYDCFTDIDEVKLII